ncbi:hypothetical protein G1H11_06595 [Phytoactinopolyspora alkaliphila]|uniref:Heparin-binding hemagglutinin n=1 Tax=Phytoactinopolyspora alkaliphila TaxID=1783498 RepID=A0A6N9YJA2_9ACTN|nr:hypothetical protein [Phytoactinopolyspora alkaliphila]NED94978.1 hypothetical protein [Phytoactinopolyspora alkaliphila]
MSTNTTLDGKPVRAVAGAADATAAAIRDLSSRVIGAVSDENFRHEVRERFSELSGRVSAAVTDERFREDMRKRLADLPAEARALGDELPEFLKDIPVKAAELPERAREAFTWERRHELMTDIPARVRDAAAQAAQQAGKTYDQLADRGQGAMAKWRGDYEELLGERVAVLRSRVADAADDVADSADKLADDLHERK